MKKYRKLILPPLIVTCLMLLFFAVCRISPFGGKTIAWCDMEQQVIPLMLEFRDVLRGDGSMFYSFGNAGGMNMWGVYFFFVVSPLSLLTVFVSDAAMLPFMNILVILKMTLAALTAALYFRRRYPKLHTPGAVLLSVMYALCGYGFQYFQNLIWLDLLYLFPLLMLSMDSLIRKKRVMGYILCCSACVAIMYYLGYSIALFLILAMGLQLMTMEDKTARNWAALRFVMSSALAVGITAVVWLPSFLQVMGSGRVGSTLDNLRDAMVVDHFGTKISLFYCTALTLVPLFFLYGKRKIYTSQYMKYMYVLLMLPVLFEPINLMWHTGSYQCYPIRYGYMTVLVALSLIAELLYDRPMVAVKRPWSPKIMLILCNAGLLLSIVLLCRFRYQTICSYVHSLWQSVDSTLWLTIPFLFSLAACIIGVNYYRAGQLSRRALTIALSCVCLLESTLNFAVYMNGAAVVDTLYPQTLAIADSVPEQDDDFYRVRMEQKYSHVNMLGAMGYNTIAHYTSLTADPTMRMMKKLGYSSYWMEISTTGGTLLSDMLLANRYVFGLPEEFASWQPVIGEAGVFTIAENRVPMSAGLVLPAAPEAMEALTTEDRIAAQQALAKAYYGLEDAVTVYAPTRLRNVTKTMEEERYHLTREPDSKDTSISYNIYVSGQQALYFDVFDRAEGAVMDSNTYGATAVTVNGQRISDAYPLRKSNGILSLGTFENAYVTVKVTLYGDIDAASFGLFGLDVKQLTTAAEASNLATVHTSGSHLAASCTAQDGDYLYLSVPYEDGFTATVNGKETPISVVDSCFMAVPLDAGKNEISMRFLPKGFQPALLLSILSVIILLLYYLLHNRITKRSMTLALFCYRLLIFVFCGVIAVVYVATMILNAF